MLNIPNLASSMWYFDYQYCNNKLNPKVYLGAVQSVANGWNSDPNMGQSGSDKSGSWPQI
ncbi:MAG TPA: hypothetical protein DCY93_03940 [Firmicutes bacterium]|nr:hypothetical protein [Bacillota bacterium]